MKMIDVSDKPENPRKALAIGRLVVEKDTIKLIKEGRIEKGDPVNASKVAGLLGLKNTPNLLPFCHPIRVTNARVDLEIFDEGVIEVRCEVHCVDRTGAEMEALTGCAIACLNLYDMLKRYEKWARIVEVKLVEKEGGKSGHQKLGFEYTGKAINLGRSATRGPKEKVKSIRLIANFGVEGDVHAGTEKEVSVFPLEALAKVPKDKFTFSIDDITENITIIGIPEYLLLPGKRLVIGEAELEILQIGKENFVNEGRPYAVSRWGRFCRVVKGGTIELYDEVRLLI
ncbi:MAG: cyclic pyranopterin monophosphate synthase MoaC [candidate division WOR-3 bacterium]